MSYLLFGLVLSVLAFPSFHAQQSTCLSAKDCTSCMKAGPDCAWCEDQNFTNIEQINRPRCNPISLLPPAVCAKTRFLNSSVNILKNEDFSSTVQTSPQRLKMVLRPGQSQKFQVTVQPAENFPVDIYVLMDLSASMKDDLRNLALLTEQIASSIGNITTNFRLGFGAFIDKPTTPYIPVRPADFPCAPSATCRPVFGYVHLFNFSSNSTAFSAALNKTAISGDVDKPEDPFDGLMQAAVCEDVINWKPKGASRRIVMIVTDALPKSAGDGKTGGIIKPNDEKCYMGQRSFLDSKEKYYTKATEMDYPSVKQLKNVMFKYGITPILAVTEDVLPIYQKIAEEWADLGAAADVLSSNSDNIVQLLRDNYNKISTTVTLSDDSPSSLKIDYQVDPESCANIVSSGECSNVKLNQSIVFDVTVTLQECPTGEEKKTVTVKTAGFGDITIDLEYLCDCNCERINNSAACNGQGTYECGICECNQGRFGHLCRCDSSQPSHNITETCRDSSNPDGPLCNGDGQCTCGRCECFPQPSPDNVITGQFCGCRNFGCPRYNQTECGGKERGKCTCGVCECIEPYEGTNCGTTNCDVVLNTKCRKSASDKICSENGKCDCKTQRCNCDVGFIGEFCEICVSPQCRCDAIQECVRCEITNTTCDPSRNCSMHSYSTTNDTISNFCTMFIDTCEYLFNITGDPLKKGEPLDLVYKPTFRCAGSERTGEDDDPNLLAIILGIIAGILLLGLLLLLLWKVLVTMHDKHEYARFQKSQSNDSQWEKDGNPIYREPNQQFVNPAFAGSM